MKKRTKMVDRKTGGFGSLLLCLLAGIFLQNCKVAEPQPLPEVVQLPGKFGEVADSASMADLDYNDFFNDPLLIKLVDKCLQHNPDFLALSQQIPMAKGDLLVAESFLLPRVSGVASAGVDRFGEFTIDGVGNYDTNLSDAVTGNRVIPDPVPDYFIGFRSSWEIDLWGRLREQKKSAMARFLASEKGVQLLQTELVAQVAALYYELLALAAELDILNKNIELQETALELVEIQKAAGRVNELAVSQVQAQLFNTQALQASLQQRYTATENYLNLMMGQLPEPVELGTSIQEQPLPDQIKTGIPTDMLLRRPDIRAAELELAATKADVEAARKAFLPSLNLTPYVGLNSFRASVLFDPRSVAAGAVAGMAAPLFNRKHLKGNLNRRDAARLQAFYRYQKRILAGMEEVYTGLKNFENLEKAISFKQAEVAALNQAVNNSQQLFVAGYATYLEVVTAQGGVLEAELDLIDLYKELHVAQVELYRALGGGWK